MIEALSGFIADVCEFLQPGGILGVFGGALTVAALIFFVSGRGFYGKITAALRRISRQLRCQRPDTTALRCAAAKLPPELMAKAEDGAAVQFYVDSHYRAALFSKAGGSLLLLCGALCPVLYLALFAAAGASALIAGTAVLLFFCFGAVLALFTHIFSAWHLRKAKERGACFSAAAALILPSPIQPETAAGAAEEPQRMEEEREPEPEPMRYTPYVFDGYDCPHEDVIDRISEIPKSESPMHEMQAIAALLREERYKPENKTPTRKRNLDEAYKRLLDAVREYAAKEQ